HRRHHPRRRLPRTAGHGGGGAVGPRRGTDGPPPARASRRPRHAGTGDRGHDRPRLPRRASAGAHPELGAVALAVAAPRGRRPVGVGRADQAAPAEPRLHPVGSSVPVFIGGPVHGGEDAGSVHRGPGAPAVIVPRYRTAFIACFFLVATAAYTWPLPLHPATHLLHPTTPINPFALADYYLNSWILSWVAHALRTDPLRLFEANVFYPCPHSLAFSEHILSGALLTLPLDVVHHDPILAQNVLLLASYVLGGIGTAIILCDLEASIPAALLGGSLFIFNPIRPNQIGHIQHMSSHWMPFALLFLTRLLRKGSWTTGAAFGGMLLLAELTTVYYTYYFGLTVVLFVVLHAAFRCRAVPNAYIRAIGIGAVVVLALAPTFLPLLQAREEFALARDPLVPQVYSASAIT